MRYRYAFSVCLWRPNAKWKNQLDLCAGGLKFCSLISEVWPSLIDAGINESTDWLTVIVDLDAKDGPKICTVVGHIPERYCDDWMGLQTRMEDAKNKILHYALCALLDASHMQEAV